MSDNIRKQILADNIKSQMDIFLTHHKDTFNGILHDEFNKRINELELNPDSTITVDQLAFILSKMDRCNTDIILTITHHLLTECLYEFFTEDVLPEENL